MPSEHEIDLDPEEQAILRAWRLLVSKHYLEDIQHLQGNPGIIHGFEIAHRLVCDYEDLRMSFHLNPTRFHELGHQVMREQFDENMVRMRPIIRVVELDEDYHRRIDTLRMRDRNKVVSITVKINDISPSYGWVQEAVYECKRCKEQTTMKQRRARERESPSHCETCFARLLKRLDMEEEPYSVRPPRPQFVMSTEHSNYEDVQDIQMCQAVFSEEGELLHVSQEDEMVGVVSDDLVGELEKGSCARVNGIVRVEPFPNRTFSKDTRRVLSLQVLSVEVLGGEA
jgi:DNA replicative helicase MCM subunit Mcm2 (Cdc46/Mcm family)